ncbi:hypothetical protein rosag_09260 [Roseisolibacter agri]|uniref:HYR domain-containing protein n=1 Tax=Roseisolibacter agri TaxID=2014610 RepID=A0AA37QES2_9BACT|nr:hypothetical protein rosag_09260 [Roseisolibacter agri]
MQCDAPSPTLFPFGSTNVICFAVDAAGNSKNTHFTVRVQDTTNPQLTMPPTQVVQAAPGAQEASVSFTVHASDVADPDVQIVCDAESGAMFPIGTTQVTCAAYDNFWNSASGSFLVVVESVPTFAFTGFFQPVANDGVFNVVKAGSAIPVKFSLDGNRGLAILKSGSPSATTVSCVSEAAQSAVGETVAASGNSLSYDAATDQYIYVWKSEKGWAGGCRRLDVTLTDGRTKSAFFRFTR